MALLISEWCPTEGTPSGLGVGSAGPGAVGVRADLESFRRDIVIGARPVTNDEARHGLTVTWFAPH